MNDQSKHLIGGTPVDLSNWRIPPYSTWAFQNIKALMPAQEILNDPDNVQLLPSKNNTFDGLRIKTGQDAYSGLIPFLEETATDSFVVMLNGNILYEYYDHGMQPQTLHTLMSVSKSILGIIAGILYSKGILDVEALVTDYYPELAITAYAGATIRNLLDMRTGITLNEEQLSRYNIASNWAPSNNHEKPQTFDQFFTTLPAEHTAHGGSFNYFSPNADLLGLLIERVTNKKFSTLASELLWKPMGAEDGAYITTDRAGAARCTGGICANTRDMARIGSLILQKRQRDGVSIVTEEWLNDLIEGGSSEAWNTGPWAAGFGMNMRYRSGWYVIDDHPKMIFALGNHGQHIFVDTENKLVIAKTSSQEQLVDVVALQKTFSAVAAIRQYLLFPST